MSPKSRLGNEPQEPGDELFPSCFPVQVRGWLKGRGEEFVMKTSDIGDSVETAQALEEQHEKFEAKARVSNYC